MSFTVMFLSQEHLSNLQHIQSKNRSGTQIIVYLSRYLRDLMISCWDATYQITHPEDFGDLQTFHQDKCTFKIFIEGPDHIPAPQRMNPSDSIDHMIFPPAPSSGQTFHLRTLWL